MYGHDILNQFPGIAGGYPKQYSLFPANFQKIIHALFQRHLITVFIPCHRIPIRLNLLDRIRKPETLLKVTRRFAKTHPLDDLLQVFRQFDAEFSKIFYVYLSPHPHGVHKRTVQVKNNRIYIFKHFLKPFRHTAYKPLK